MKWHLSSNEPSPLLIPCRCRRREYTIARQPGDPLSGGTMALLGSVGGVVKSVVHLPVEVARSVREKPGFYTESRAGNGIPASLDQVRRGSLTPKIPKLNLHQCGAHPAAIEEGHCSAISQSSTQRLSSRLQGQSNSSFAPEKDVNNAHVTPSQSTIPLPPQLTFQSHTSSSSSLSFALATSQSFDRILETTLTAPMAFTLGMIKGFRNAPTLYGDTTARPATKVTGWQSGIRAAGKEFGLGMYDGLSGMVTQPYQGARREGGLGRGSRALWSSLA